MLRSRLRNKFLKTTTDESKRVYIKQKDLCVNLLRKAKRKYFADLDKRRIIVQLQGNKFNNILSLENHVSSFCTKASQKLHALTWIVNHKNLSKRKALMKTSVISQFNYCPLAWMFHSGNLNHCINSIHEKVLSVMYQDYEYTFFELI